MKIRVTASKGTVVGVSQSVGEAMLAAGIALRADEHDGPEVVHLPAGEVETRPAKGEVETR